uniref:ANK_REP_REGION domain-containing protein n=1 Tax=Caenorhabditis tropicalis TaxID=1561998 RepID=A0A1I7U5P6_9PELO
MTALQNVARRLGDVQIQMASLLINKGAKIDADGGSRKDSDKFKGRTALHHAAFMNNIQMVEFLVRQNANKDKQDEEGRTPIMLAALEGHETIVRFLITQGASIEVVDALDRSARQLAEHNKHDHVIDIIDHCRPEMHFGMEMHYQAPTTQRKVARATYKSVKKQGKTKKESPVAPAAVSSRDSTHLTPPPSDGSTSSPSPQHFMTATTHATPPSSHNWSPDYQGNSEAFQPQCSAYPGWYSNTSANNAQYVGSAYPY